MIPVTARHIKGDTWEVAMPKRKSAVRHKDGVRPRRTVHAESEQDAIEAGRELFEREYIAYKMGVTMNLADLTVYYIDHAESEGIYTSDTADDYRAIVLRYVEPNFGMDVDEVKPIDIERLYSYLMNEGGAKGDGISPNSIHKLNSVLRAAYSFFVREGVTVSNPIFSVELPSRVHPEKRALTEREFSKILTGLENELRVAPEAGDVAGIKRRNCLFGAYLDMWIGARVGEVCAITRGQIRAIESSIRLDHSISERGGLHRKEPKTPAGRRTVAPGDEPFAMLREHYAWQASYLTDAQRDSDNTPVCCTVDGGFIRPSDMSAEFKAFCTSIGVELKEGESFHVLRHTHASQLLSNKVNPKEVQNRLGHSRIETTFLYSHVMPGEDAETAANYSEIVERARKGGDLR